MMFAFVIVRVVMSSVWVWCSVLYLSDTVGYMLWNYQLHGATCNGVRFRIFDVLEDIRYVLRKPNKHEILVDDRRNRVHVY